MNDKQREALRDAAWKDYVESWRGVGVRHIDLATRSAFHNGVDRGYEAGYAAGAARVNELEAALRDVIEAVVEFVGSPQVKPLRDAMGEAALSELFSIRDNVRAALDGRGE